MKNRSRGFQACVKVRGPQDLEWLPQEAHGAEPLLNDTREHGVPISMTRVMNGSKLNKSTSYGAHALELKETIFFSKELSEQLHAGHMDILPLAKVRHLNVL